MTSTIIEQRPGRRLDMEHGFLKYIQRNQINRDEFNKIQEKRKQDIKERLKTADRKKTNAIESTRRLYVPPALRKQHSCEETSSDDYSTVEDNEVKTPSINRSSIPLRPNSIIFNESEEKIIREGVRRRFMKSSQSVDEICFSLANSSIQDDEEKINITPNYLFTLQLSLKNGLTESFEITNDIKAARTAKILSRQFDFNDNQCRELRIFLDQQLEKRLKKIS